MELFMTDLHRRNVRADFATHSGKENLKKRKTFLNGPEILCPVTTSTAVAIVEQPELRAYKLGKQKCSYNQVELDFKDTTATGRVSQLKVSEAIETMVGTEVDASLRESCLKFNVRLLSNQRIHLYIYAVYANPYCSTPGMENNSLNFHWMPVTRSKCRKGCTGPVIRGLQRFGRMSRRASTANGYEGEDTWKEPRHLYIAIDEASTHVCPRPETSNFRLLLAAYDEKYELLGTTISSSIRVLANNDAPLGAASFKLHCNLKACGGTRSLSPSHARFLETCTERICCRVPLQDIAQNNPPSGQNASNRDETPSLGTADTLTSRKIQNEAYLAHAVSYCTETDFFQHSTNISTSVCKRLFQLCASKKDTILDAKNFAAVLGCGRQEIADIFEVLQCFEVVRQEGKGKYIWQNRSRLSQILRKFQMEAAKTSVAGLQTEISVSILCRKLIQLLLANQSHPVPWENVVETIFAGIPYASQPFKAEVRKLCEVASIFSIIQLITLRWVDKGELGMGLLLEWIGVQGLESYLAANGKLSSEQPTPQKRKGASIQNCALDGKDTHYSYYREEKKGHSCSSDDEANSSTYERNCLTVVNNKEEDELEEEEDSEQRPTKRATPQIADVCDLYDKHLKSQLTSSCRGARLDINPAEHSCDDCFTGQSRVCPIYSLTQYDEDEATKTEDVMSMETEDTQFGVLPNLELEKEGQNGSREDRREDAALCMRILANLTNNVAFDPFYHLRMLLTPEQVAIIQQENPAFLFNFVRYYRQFHHMFKRTLGEPSGIVSYAVPRRLQSFQLHPCSTSELNTAHDS